MKKWSSMLTLAILGAFILSNLVLAAPTTKATPKSDRTNSTYTQEELEKNLEIKYHYYNISSQMASDEGFNKKIEELLGVKLDDLVKYENAFGVDKGY